jgi:CubicO group peptidase (beta-lactamase class C family)
MTGDLLTKAVPGLAEAVDGLAQSQLAAGLAHGMQVCVHHRGETVLDRCYGHVGGRPEAVTPDTRFALYSTSKILTLTALHVLVDAGEVRCAEPVATYVPEFAAHGKGDITLSQLLGHRAGISDVPSTIPFEAYFDPDEALRHICALVPTSPPGAVGEYHPLTALTVAAEVVRRVSGQPFEQFCDVAVLQPLQLTRTTWGVPAEIADLVSDTVGDCADNDVVDRSWRRPEARAAVIPSGGAYSTASDVARLLQEWLTPSGLLSPATAAAATAIHYPASETCGFGLGFWVGADHRIQDARGASASPRSFGHPGLCSVQAFADPDVQLVIVVLTNVNPGLPESNARFAAMSDLIYRHVQDTTRWGRAT